MYIINTKYKNQQKKKQIKPKNGIKYKLFNIFFFKKILEIFVNSTKANEKITIDINKYIILLINIKTNIKNSINPVFILLVISAFN